MHNITQDALRALPHLPQATTLKINMSDGVQIWTRIVNPWPYEQKKPACVVRSPYGSYFTQNMALMFTKSNRHVAVMQEARGTWSSGGTFDLFRGSSQDAKDTFDWVARQEWSDGEIYSMGASADGMQAFAEAFAQPHRLHGQWLMWTALNGHHLAYPGGAFRKDLMEGWLGFLAGFTHGASKDLILPAIERHEAMGPWWYNLTDCASLRDPDVKPGCRFANVKWPTIVSGSWWDLFHHATVDMWKGLRSLSHPTVRDDHVLIYGPLGHGLVGKLDLGIKEAARLRAAEVEGLAVAAELAAEFWNWSHCADERLNTTCRCQGRVRFGAVGNWSEPRQVRGNVQCGESSFGGDPAPGKLKECQCQQATGPLRQRIGRVNLFIMGGFGAEWKLGPGNYWTSLDGFPSTTGRQLYLRDRGLGQTPPDTPVSVFYTYDPAKPTPMIGGNNLPHAGNIEFIGPANQLERDSRADVVVFDSEPLPEPLAIVGEVRATLFVSSSAPDTDFVVVLSDLSADGSKAMMVRYGIQRMRWRESETNRSAALVAGRIYEAVVNLRYTGYIFPKGHRIRVTISSAADPYYVRSSNTGENDMTVDADPIVAKNGVHFSPEHPSRVTLPVVALSQIPENPHFTTSGPHAQARPAQELII